ncbi:MAG TPA: TRAP transporter substrate-binding protein DctP [Desulfatiglandales bacterium]|nr:TRAP transporter substrate-binding protein DctP [Desulfatiglandales bacterium]
MKKVLIVCTMLATVAVLADWSAPKETIAKEPSVRTLKLATLYSEGKELFKSVQFFTNEIEKRTQGKIKFKIFPGNSLVPSKQALSAVHTNVVDSAFVPAAYEQQLWPLTGMLMTFGAPNITYEKFRHIHDQLRKIINKNLDINVVILGMPHILNYFYYSKEPLKGKLMDFENALVRSAGGAYDASFKALGCRPVQIPASEVYMALQKGTIDSGWNIYSRYTEGKLYEVAPHVVVIPKGMVISGQHFVINKRVWNSFPADIQRVLLEVGRDVVAFTNDMSSASDKRILEEVLPKLNIEPIIMNETENELLIKKLESVWGPVIGKFGKTGEEIAKIIGVR